MAYAVLDPRKRSLLRGTVLVLGSLYFAFVLAGFPNDRPSLALIVPAMFALLGTWDTLRCLRAHWSFYHGAVVLLLYSDIMALLMILFLLFYPYAQWILL